MNPDQIPREIALPDARLSTLSLVPPEPEGDNDTSQNTSSSREVETSNAGPLRRGTVGDEDSDLNEGDSDWTWKRWLWNRTSSSALRDAEQAILTNLKQRYTQRYVHVGPVIGDKDIRIWTFSQDEDLPGTPLVMLHGFASGLALWVLNYQRFAEAKQRPVYAIDIPGFGRSSRPHYSSDPAKAEAQLVSLIDAWLNQMGMRKVILLGHSFGAYICFSYALQNPHRVSHLICCDPWGFNNSPDSLGEIAQIPAHHRFFANLLLTIPMNPLWPLRACGPLGPMMFQIIRADLISNFQDFHPEYKSMVANYVYHCNVQEPTGEAVFYHMMNKFGWAKNPMHQRIHFLHSDVPLTLIYGARSWVDHFPAEEIVKIRKGSFVEYHILDASHHVYADQVDIFSEIVLSTCIKGRSDRAEASLSLLSIA